MDRFAEMDMFVRVIEAGGFTEAARRAGVSKSAVSKQISALEQRLGARLLNRTTRRVSPTEIGLAYYDRAARVLAEAEEADAIAAALQGAPRGELRISAPQSFGTLILAPVVGEFIAEHPEVRVHMTLDDRFVELISEGFDLAVRIGALEDSSLRAKRVGESQLQMIASPAYLKRKGEPRAIEDLADHDLLHYSYLASGRSWKLTGPGGVERQVRANGPLTINNGSALVTAAEQGLGIVLSPDFICADSLRAGRVRAVLPEAAPAPNGIWAVTPPGRFMQPKVRAFVDFLSLYLKRAEADAAGRQAGEARAEGLRTAAE
ncbi:MAG: LysR family transcriptional regulator [Rhodobacteraceae bacterium]|nr:LysR family transcriptional regulator [Paracoccaceae bacterium]